MKKMKLFCKLIGMVFTIFMMCFCNAPNGYIHAISCKSVVEQLSNDSILLKNGEEFWLFDQEHIEVENAWDAFDSMMSKNFGDSYTANVSAENNPQVLDSINFLFLSLYFYQKSFERMVDAEDAKQATQTLHLMHRDFNEQARDRTILQGLSEVNADFNHLKQILA